MITDNLAPLFAAAQPGARFRQGTVITWDSGTGANTIDLAGSVLTNVKVLTTGEAIALKPGHVVVLLGQGSTWWIMGRVAGFGDADFAGSSVAFGRAQAFTQGGAVPIAPTTQASDNLIVPSWVDEVAITCTVTASVVNSTSSRQEVLLSAAINGVNGAQMATGIAPNTGAYNIAALSAAYSAIITNPPATIPVACVSEAPVLLAANGFNTFTVDAIALFRSTV